MLYVAVLAACLCFGFGLTWTSFGERIDDIFYDSMMGRAEPGLAAAKTSSVIVAIDEDTLRSRGGMRSIREILAEALDEIAEAGPKLVASDVVLADATDEKDDKRLAASLRATKNLILPCEVDPKGKWEDPLPEFNESAVARGHVDLNMHSADAVNREIPLRKQVGPDHRWALSLEAFAVFEGQHVVDFPFDNNLQVGDTVIPEPKEAADRPLLIQYLPPHTIPQVSALEIRQNRDLIRGSAVFLGITALSAARDRLTNPYGDSVSGVEVHAQAFETMRRGVFLVPADYATVLFYCLIFAIAAGAIFMFVPGWWAYAADVVLLAMAFWLPVEAFHNHTVGLFFGPVAVAWLASASAAIFQHFFVRRQLRTSESEKSRYQQAIHWVAHEMRSPLTAIQGSSEIMTRYKLPEEKGKQLSEMINAESKRMARMIQTFLDVERLADGQMEMKMEPFEASQVVDACLKRVQPIADGKKIKIYLDNPVEAVLTGDRELMEYAFYNLLTNAVKYSPRETEVHVGAEVISGELHLAVRDQGIGMDAQELKSIFKKFYRTKRAEASGEVGTGIGLSIVEQIVTSHKGRMEVSSEPGKGSCFTIIVFASNPKVPPAADNSADSRNAETFNR